MHFEIALADVLATIKLEKLCFKFLIMFVNLLTCFTARKKTVFFYIWQNGMCEKKVTEVCAGKVIWYVAYDCNRGMEREKHMVQGI